jgi:soluble epoxide hydrolase/lipid-phosphate phosphatase
MSTRYRVRHLNHDQEVNLNPTIDQFPCLMVTAGKDPALSPAMAKRMPQLIKHLTMDHIEECAHWMQVEHAEETNRKLEKWLVQKVDGGKGKL